VAVFNEQVQNIEKTKSSIFEVVSSVANSSYNEYTKFSLKICQMYIKFICRRKFKA